MTSWQSSLLLKMKPFFARLFSALKALPNNPKPECGGFFIAIWDHTSRSLVVEKIGEVPSNKEFKYLHLAAKKATQMLHFGYKRSKDFMDPDLEQYQGGIIYQGNAVGVSGHDAEIDEAIALLFLVAMEEFGFGATDIAKSDFLYDAQEAQINMVPDDNPWVMAIANLMVEQDPPKQKETP